MHPVHLDKLLVPMIAPVAHAGGISDDLQEQSWGKACGIGRSQMGEGTGRSIVKDVREERGERGSGEGG